VKTVADRYIHATLATGFLDLLTSMNLNNFELSKKGFIVNFSQFVAAAHILRVSCYEMAGGRPRQTE